MNIIKWNVQYYNYLYPSYEETGAEGPDAGQTWSQSKSDTQESTHRKTYHYTSEKRAKGKNQEYGINNTNYYTLL